MKTNTLLNRKLLLTTLFVAVGILTTDTALAASREPRPEASGRFEPRHGQVLVFIGQDNASVGGNAEHRDGYVDHVGMPGGVTHYVYFTEGATNNFGYTFDKGTVDGLNKQTTWGAGPMCMRCYLESDAFDGTAVHLSISMEFNSEDSVASGDYDHLIRELAAFLQEFSHVPFYIRIGYEFDGSWNDYDQENFKAAWRRIVDHLRAEKIENFVTVFGSSRNHIARETWDAYWPGDEYVDWIGYSFWYNEPVKQWWVKKMAEPGYLHGPEGLYTAIGFEPGR